MTDSSSGFLHYQRCQCMAASRCVRERHFLAHLIPIFGLVPEDMPNATQVMVDQGESNCSLEGVQDQR